MQTNKNGSKWDKPSDRVADFVFSLDYWFFVAEKDKISVFKKNK